MVNICRKCSELFTKFSHLCKTCCDKKQPNNEQRNTQQQRAEEDRINNEKKLKWIKILSNPLYISVEWLWRRNSNCQCEDCQKKNEDVIEGALHDAYLLEKISSYEHHYSRDEYKKSVEAYEMFAANVLKNTSSSELYEIMDIEGNGCLLQEDSQQHRNFIQSLRLLKIATDKRRKKVCALS